MKNKYILMVLALAVTAYALQSFSERDCSGLSDAGCSHAKVVSKRTGQPFYDEARRYSKYGALARPAKKWYSDLEVVDVLSKANKLRKELM